MRHRAVILLLHGLCCASFGRSVDAQTKFLSQVFPVVPLEQRLTLDREQARLAGRIRSGRYTSVPYWQEGHTSAWVLQTRAKTGSIQTIFAVRDGKIIDGEVLQFQEYLGRQVCSPEYLSQFSGVSLRNDRQLDRDIDGITGATLTSGAMRDMARLALFFDSLLVAPPD